MTTADYSSWKPIALKRDSVCAHCEIQMPTGAQALWSRAKSQVACLKHLNSNDNPSSINDNKVMDTILKTRQEDLVIPTVTGVAGIGARKISDKKQAKTDAKHVANKNRLEETHPIVGGLLSSFYDVVMTDKDVQTKGQQINAHAWKYGASGEEGIGKILNELAEKYGFYVLHDRRQGKHTQANIDHMVITSNAVYIIDAKNYTGMVEVETNGRLNGNKPIKLKVGGQNRMKLVDGMHKQVAIVEKVLKEAGTIMPVVGVLAFYKADWPLFGTPTEIQGVLVNGRGLEAIFSKQGDYMELARKEAWVAVTEALPEVK